MDVHTDHSFPEHENDPYHRQQQLLPGCFSQGLSSNSVHPFILQSQEGLGYENQDPSPNLAGFSNTLFPHGVPLSFSSTKIGSNDIVEQRSRNEAIENEHKGCRALQHKPLNTIINTSNRIRRPQSRAGPEFSRPYLQHPKYIEYRSRPRQEIGKDGKPIWPDIIEAAFQNGKFPPSRTRQLSIHSAFHTDNSSM